MARGGDGDRELIREQIEYYERRAPEYDQTATPEDDPLAPQGDRLVAALNAFRPRGRILELACGTGTWTGHLLAYSDDITALDSSKSMVDLNRQKVGDPHVRYVLADVFDWEPGARYDVVFFANWLSHVPPSRFEQFWRLVDRALAPGGRVFFVDEAEDAWRHEETLAEEFLDDHVRHGSAKGGIGIPPRRGRNWDSSIPLVRRRLRDGSAYRVVKVFWDPAALEERLRELGWSITTGSTGAFYWGEGGRAG